MNGTFRLTPRGSAASLPIYRSSQGLGSGPRPSLLLAPRITPSASSSIRRARPSSLRVNALDAAMPFDFEARMQERIMKEKQMTIGIVGFGNFGQFLAKRFIKHGHRVIGLSRTDYRDKARDIGAEFFDDADDFCEEHPDVVILATSIISTEKVLFSLPLQRLKRNTLFVDVLSVKEFPKKLMLKTLPPYFDILCLHPMFGPDSGRGSWQGLPLVYDKVRIGSDKKRLDRVNAFLSFWEHEGCRMVEMTCEEHDRQAASTQFITHTVGRVLGKMELQSTSINTKGFEALLNLVNNTNNDSFDLYYGLFMYNQNATEELDRLEKAFDLVKKQLFTELHDILRSQLFESERSAGGSGGAGGAAQLPRSKRAKREDGQREGHGNGATHAAGAAGHDGHGAVAHGQAQLPGAGSSGGLVALPAPVAEAKGTNGAH